jgi:beta-1,4-mannosyltransferase
LKRVLIPHATSGNLYVEALGAAYRQLGCEVVYGVDNLLQRNFVPDLLHVQWPEEGYRWRNDLTLEGRATRFKEAVSHVRGAGAFVVATAHNVAPHEHSTNGLDLSVYQHIIDNADVLHHHCGCSIDAYRTKYSIPKSARHLVVPHPHFDLYPRGVTGAVLRERLGIPAKATVYLQFGNIRGYKGIESLLQAFDRARVADKHLLVVGQYQAPSGVSGARQRLQLALRKRWPGNLTLIGQAVPNEVVRSYVEASDCMVLTHTAGLNSGVAVLAMSMGKMVIGPRLGCMEWVLAQGSNLTYQTGDVAAASRAMEQLAEMPAETRRAAEAQNRAVALEWRWEHLAQAVLSAAEHRKA